VNGVQSGPNALAPDGRATDGTLRSYVADLENACDRYEDILRHLVDANACGILNSQSGIWKDVEMELHRV
jgi:hypothetical protein